MKKISRTVFFLVFIMFIGVSFAWYVWQSAEIDVNVSFTSLDNLLNYRVVGIDANGEEVPNDSEEGVAIKIEFQKKDIATNLKVYGNIYMIKNSVSDENIFKESNLTWSLKAKTDTEETVISTGNFVSEEVTSLDNNGDPLTNSNGNLENVIPMAINVELDEDTDYILDVIEPDSEGYLNVDISNMNIVTSVYSTSDAPETNEESGSTDELYIRSITYANGVITGIKGYSSLYPINGYIITSGSTPTATSSGWTGVSSSNNAAATLESGYIYEVSNLNHSMNANNNICVRNSNNEVYCKNLELDIDKPTATLCKDTTPIYNGEAQLLTKTTSGEGYTLSGYEQTEAGDYTVTAQVLDGYTWTDGSTEDVEFTCSIAKKAITVTASTSSDIYDGEAYTNNACTADGIITGHTPTCTMDSSSTITNVGNVDNVIDTVTITNGGVNVTNNYNITTAKGKLTVEKRDITITANNQSIAYGSTITQGTNQVTVTNLVTGQTLDAITLTASTSEITTTGTITPSSATIKTSNNGIVTGNYNITYVPGNLTIYDNVAPTLSVTVTGGSTYKKSHTARITISDAGGLDKNSSGDGSSVSVYYIWATSAINCNNLYGASQTAQISITDGATSAYTDVTINSGTGAGYISICNHDDIFDKSGNGLSAGSANDSASMYLDNTAPTISTSVDSGTTYAKSKTATVTLSDENSGLAGTSATIYYAWGTSSQSCSNMSKSFDITYTTGATSASGTVTIDDSYSTSAETGAGKIYVCSTITDVAGNSVERTANADMYLDNTGPTPTITSSHPLSAGLRSSNATVTFTCTDNESGVAGYYSELTSQEAGVYTSIDPIATWTSNDIATRNSTYYLKCKDALENESNQINKSFYIVAFSATNATVVSLYSDSSYVVMESGTSFSLPSATATSGYYINNENWYSDSTLSTSVGAYGAEYTPTGSITLYTAAVEKVYEIINSAGTTTGYQDSLKNARTAVEDGGTMKALKNNSINDHIVTINKNNVTLNTNGKTLTFSGTSDGVARFTITGGSITINGGGSMINTGYLDTYGILNVYANATATLDNITITNSYTSGAPAIRTAGNLTIKSGTYTSTKHNALLVMGGTLDIGTSTRTTISGYYYGIAIHSSGTAVTTGTIGGNLVVKANANVSAAALWIGDNSYSNNITISNRSGAGIPILSATGYAIFNESNESTITVRNGFLESVSSSAVYNEGTMILGSGAGTGTEQNIIPASANSYAIYNLGTFEYRVGTYAYTGKQSTASDPAAIYAGGGSFDLYGGRIMYNNSGGSAFSGTYRTNHGSWGGGDLSTSYAFRTTGVNSGQTIYTTRYSYRTG